MCKDSTPVSVPSFRSTVMAQHFQMATWLHSLGICSFTTVLSCNCPGTSRWFWRSSTGLLASCPGERAEPSSGRWNSPCEHFCQTCCTDHNRLPRWLPFIARSSQILYCELRGVMILLCCKGWGEKQQERQLHHEKCVGGMREGTKETWEVSGTFFAMTTQNNIHLTKSQYRYPWVFLGPLYKQRSNQYSWWSVMI